MTISSSNRKAGPFNGNGVTVAFPFTFKVFAQSDLYVVLANTSTGVETVQALTTNYTVSLNADQNASPGGTVTMLTAPATGFTLTLTSSIPQTQATDLTNQGGFYPSVITNALDKLTILIQQMQTYLTGALKLPVSASGVSATLPSPASGQLLSWNAAADAIVNVVPTSSSIAVPQTGVSGSAVLPAGTTAQRDAIPIAGYMRFNQTTGQFEGYNGNQWGAIGGGASAVSTQVFSGTGSQTVFTLLSAPASVGACEVFISGVAQTPTTDYTVSGFTLTFTSAPPVGSSNIFVRSVSGAAVGVPSDGTVTQAKMDGTYEATLAKINVDQQYSKPQRTTPLTDNDLSFDIGAAGAQDFVCTPTAGGTLTFTNIRAGAKGEILLVNNSNYSIAKAAAVRCPSSMLTAISATGRYRLAYSCLDGTLVDITASGALS